MSAGALGLYLHIPFCDSICSYCNFNRGLRDPEWEPRYLSALEREIATVGDGAPVDTIYFGGGTPSVLEPDEVGRLLRACHASFDVSSTVEVSFEVNPETVTPARVEGWLEAGVTRVSLGVQSFRDEELERLGRRHDAARATEAIHELRRAGVDNLSVDLMLWLPEQTPSQCRTSIERLVDLGPDHASLYVLELYPNAPLREDMARAGWAMAPDDEAATMYLEALDRLDAAGYEQYEISNVARPSRTCRHNLKYWSDGEWLGLGCGAHSTRAGSRWQNASDVARYVELAGAGHSAVGTRHRLSENERVGDVLFTGLRLTRGLDVTDIARRYGVDVMARYGADLAPFLEAGVLLASAGRLRLTRSGMLVANEVMKTFV